MNNVFESCKVQHTLDGVEALWKNNTYVFLESYSIGYENVIFIFSSKTLN